MQPEEFRRQGHAIVDWLADYLRDIEQYYGTQIDEMPVNVADMLL